MRYKCDNCGHVDTDATLVPEIKHYSERVDTDGPEPSGECSKCGCLSYELPPTKRSKAMQAEQGEASLLLELKGGKLTVTHSDGSVLLKGALRRGGWDRIVGALLRDTPDGKGPMAALRGLRTFREG